MSGIVPALVFDSDGAPRQLIVPRPDVERILRACVAYRRRTPLRRPSQTEVLCLCLLQAERRIREAQSALVRSDRSAWAETLTAEEDSDV